MTLGAVPLVVAVAGLLAVMVVGRAASDPRATLHSELQPLSEAEQRVVLSYIEAYQEGDCETIVAMTAWMGERLNYVRTTTGDDAAVGQAKADLCAELQDRPVEGNQLSAVGIEDKYLFPPGARVRLLGRDGGRSDLGVPVAFRAWMEIAYPVDRYAPRDEADRPIRALAAAMSISPSGLVMKADVAGNLEVDPRWVAGN